MFDKKVCRLCLRQSQVTYSIYENKIVHMLEALTSKKIITNEGFSTFICLKCLLNLKMAFAFQQKIKKSEEEFKGKFTNSLSIKEESFTLETESVIINDDGNVKMETFQDLVELSDNCVICGCQVNPDLINNHIRQHLNQKQKCDLCKETFPNTQTYHKHLMKNGCKKIERKCDKCGAKFLYKTTFETHINMACLEQNKIKSILEKFHDKEDKLKVYKLGVRSSKAIKLLLGPKKGQEEHVCTTCNRKFVNKKTLMTHSHTTQTCPMCSRKVSKYNFKRHLEDHTLGPQICHFCGATLQSKSSLVTHIFYSHNNSRYKCDECGKLFKKKSTRNLHMRRDHLGKPSHYCHICGKGFYTAQFLSKHINMKHLKLRPYNCDFCQRGFSSLYALKTHTRQHTNETPYKCEICGDGFRQNVSLKAHRKSKHNIVEPKVCNCKVCGAGFASEVALFAHMRLH